MAAGEAQRQVQVMIIQVASGNMFVNDSAPYTYESYPVLTHVWPTHGPGRGGSLLEIHGTALDQRGWCRLSSPVYGDVMLVEALWVSSKLVLCEAPRHTPETLSLELDFEDG